MIYGAFFVAAKQLVFTGVIGFLLAGKRCGDRIRGAD
jgi:hypothetical protein